MTGPRTQAPYLDPSRSIEARVEDLLPRMTVEEKIGQMCQVDGRRDPERWLLEGHVGSFLNVIGDETGRLQKLAAQTRLQIPLVFGIDAIHGHAFWPASTVFPTQLALASSWSPDLVCEVGRITAREVVPTGVHWTFSPVLCMARDLRWGRVDETFGEDPYLIAELAAAMIRGYQGPEGVLGDRIDDTRILACAKHFAGYSETRGGRDAAEADHSRRKLLSLFLPPFEAAVRAGCGTLMTAYQAIDGVPCTTNRWLLTDTLRKAWGFEGLVVTDWDNVGHLHTLQRTCPTHADAAAQAAIAGNDLMMSTYEFLDGAADAIADGRLPMAIVDAACRRMLRFKLRLGLFDGRRLGPSAKALHEIGGPDHRAAALDAAYRSAVLVKNEGPILPLSTDSTLTHIALLGSNAHNPDAQLGNWSFRDDEPKPDWMTTPRTNVVTLLDGLRARVGDDIRLSYATGADAAEAAALADAADVAILVVGDDPTRSGEGRDCATLELPDEQLRLIDAVVATKTPIVAVLINSKPLVISRLADHAAAILVAWNPGGEGGTAVAGLLFGDRDPSGRLPISWPRHVGQQPVFYNDIAGWHAEAYVDSPAEPLYPFGFGLTYTQLELSNLRLTRSVLKPGEALELSVDVANVGPRQGRAVIQTYIHDRFASVTTPIISLQAFESIELVPGERQSVAVTVPYERLSLVNAQLERLVEPGEFDVRVGLSSRQRDLLSARFEVKAESAIRESERR